METLRADNRALLQKILPKEVTSRVALARTSLTLLLTPAGVITAQTIFDSFVPNSHVISVAEAHTIPCLGGINVTDAKPGTVVTMVDQKTGQSVVSLTIDGSRRGSARWPSGQLSNGESGPQPNQHVLAVLARVPGLTDTPRDVPCDGSTWNIRVPETIGISAAPAATSTPERPPTAPVAGVTPTPEARPAAPPPAVATAPAVSPPPAPDLSKGIDDVTKGVVALAGGVDKISGAWKTQTEKDRAQEEAASLKNRVTELEKSQNESQEKLAKVQEESKNKSTATWAGLGVGLLGLAGAVGAIIWARRRHAGPPPAPAPAAGGGDGHAADGAEPAPAAPAVPGAVPGGPADAAPH